MVDRKLCIYIFTLLVIVKETKMGSMSIWHWLVVLLIVVIVFGTKKLKNIGQDVGEAVKNFKEAVNDTETKAKEDNNSKKSD